MGLSPDGDPHCRDHPGREPDDADDAEILAAIIAGVAPGRADAVARALLQHHGSFAGMMLGFADGDIVWGEVDRPAEELLVRVARAFARSLRAEGFARLRISSPEALHTYLQLDMQSFKRETFRALFLDAGNGLLADRLLWEGTPDEVQVHPREVVRQGLDVGASAVIFAHNHPSGDPSPTAADLAATERLIGACLAVQIAVHDHVVVATRGVFSMRQAGLLDAIEGRFSEA